MILVSLDEFYKEYLEFKTDEYANICLRAFRQAKQFISLKGCSRLSDDQKKLALYLMTAHLSTLMLKNASGQAQNSSQAGQVASATVGEVSISYVQIPNQKSSFDYWLGLTPYGLELLALLDTVSCVPFYIGGSFIRVFQ